MFLNNRVILSKGGTLTDISASLADPLAGSEAVELATTDALYIGSDLPFNHRWIEVATANASPARLNVAVWDGVTWNSVVEVIDQTSVGGVALAKSGILAWTPDRDKSWALEDTTKDIPALASLTIYDLYWVRITATADIDAETELKLIGHKFSSDAQLFSQYPDLASSDLLTAFKAGKTTWDDQTFEAAEYIAQDLASMQIAWTPNMILDWQVFKNASVHKVAEIIFRAFGDDYQEKAIESMKAYKAAMNVKNFMLDRNQNARIEPVERIATTGWITR